MRYLRAKNSQCSRTWFDWNLVNGPRLFSWFYAVVCSMNRVFFFRTKGIILWNRQIDRLRKYLPMTNCAEGFDGFRLLNSSLIHSVVFQNNYRSMEECGAVKVYLARACFVKRSKELFSRAMAHRTFAHSIFPDAWWASECYMN